MRQEGKRGKKAGKVPSEHLRRANCEERGKKKKEGALSSRRPANATILRREGKKGRSAALEMRFEKRRRRKAIGEQHLQITSQSEKNKTTPSSEGGRLPSGRERKGKGTISCHPLFGVLREKKIWARKGNEIPIISAGGKRKCCPEGSTLRSQKSVIFVADRRKGGESRMTWAKKRIALANRPRKSLPDGLRKKKGSFARRKGNTRDRRKGEKKTLSRRESRRDGEKKKRATLGVRRCPAWKEPPCTRRCGKRKHTEEGRGEFCQPVGERGKKDTAGAFRAKKRKPGFICGRDRGGKVHSMTSRERKEGRLALLSEKRGPRQARKKKKNCLCYQRETRGLSVPQALCGERGT